MSNRDIEALQTLAALANLATFVYRTILGSSRFAADSSMANVEAFLRSAEQQSIDEANRFNAATGRLGGKKQQRADSVLQPAVARKLSTTEDLLGALGIAAAVERTGAATCATAIPDLSDSGAIDLVSRVGPVQAARYSVLAVAKESRDNASLLAGGHAPRIAALSGAITGGTADAFFGTVTSRPISEGAV